MNNLLAENGVMLITFSFGYNRDLDLLIEEGGLNFAEINFLKRISKDNRWKQVKFDEIRGSKYGFPYPATNALVIAKAVK